MKFTLAPDSTDKGAVAMSASQDKPATAEALAPTRQPNPTAGPKVDEGGGGMCSAPTGHVGKLDLGLPAILLLLGGLAAARRRRT